jgi:hypothetical protein
MPDLALPTPAHHTAAPARERDPGIDAARAVAIAGVVGGHWLVTGLVVDDAGAWRQASPLAAMPALVPVSWLLQTLGLFFFAGGFAAARSTGRRRSAAALIRPLLLLLGSWTAALAVAAMLRTPRGTLRAIAVLVVSPLWFLLPYLALRLVTPVLTRLVDRSGPAAVAGPAIAVVAGSDAGLLPGWTAVPAAWSVPWVLGIALARGRRPTRGNAPAHGRRPTRGTPPAPGRRPTRDIAPARGRRPPGAVLLLAGVTGMVVLVRGLGYPAAAVGVPGDGRSNLDPPSLFAVALAAAQIGAFLLLRDRRRSPTRARSSAPSEGPGAGGGTAPNGGLVQAVNRAALPIYLSHQSVLVAAAAIGGNTLVRPPADASWIMLRAAWLPFLAFVLAAVTAPRWWTIRRAQGA